MNFQNCPCYMSPSTWVLWPITSLSFIWLLEKFRDDASTLSILQQLDTSLMSFNLILLTVSYYSYLPNGIWDEIGDVT